MLLEERDVPTVLAGDLPPHVPMGARDEPLPRRCPELRIEFGDLLLNALGASSWTPSAPSVLVILRRWARAALSLAACLISALIACVSATSRARFASFFWIISSVSFGGAGLLGTGSGAAGCCSCCTMDDALPLASSFGVRGVRGVRRRRRPGMHPIVSVCARCWRAPTHQRRGARLSDSFAPPWHRVWYQPIWMYLWFVGALGGIFIMPRHIYTIGFLPRLHPCFARAKKRQGRGTVFFASKPRER